MQHKEYKDAASFTINSSDGSEFHVSPMINYQVNREKVPVMFTKFRKELPDIEDGYLKTTLMDSYRMIANAYTAEELISHRQKYETQVRRRLDSLLLCDGFVITQQTSNLGYPETFKRNIEAKNNAVQAALTAENQVKTAEARAKISVAEAQGKADAMLTLAKAEAESNRLRQQSMTPLILQKYWIDKWNGALPSVSAGQSTGFMLNLPK